MKKFRKNCRRNGVTLIESIISTLLVGALAVTSLQSTHALIRSRHELSFQRQAHALAEQYLTEIMQVHFGTTEVPVESGNEQETDMGSTFGKTLPSLPPRQSLRHLDEFHQRVESPPQRRDGSNLPGFGNDWSVSIEIHQVRTNSIASLTTQDFGLKRISATVNDPAGNQVVLQSFRARLGCNEMRSGRDRQFIQAIGLNLKLDGCESNFIGGIKPLDLAPKQ